MTTIEISLSYQLFGRYLQKSYWLQAKSMVKIVVLDELLYVDDIVDNAKTETKMQLALDRVSKTFDNYDLTIGTKRLR